MADSGAAGTDGRRPATLLRDTSRSVFWNSTLLPLVSALGLLTSVFIRRAYGLESGTYDVLLGLMNSILFYSSLGLAGSLPKFLPEVQVASGRREVMRLLRRLFLARFAVLAVLLVLLNVWAEPLARQFSLDAGGRRGLYLLTPLLAARAVLELSYRALDSLFQQLRVNLLSLLNGALDLVLIALAVAGGWSIPGVVGALAASALATAAIAGLVLASQIARLPENPAGGRPTDTRLWQFVGVTYARDLCLYFATPAFASPALASALGSPEPVALFATSFFVASATVTLMVSGFRGVYRPALARVLASGDASQLRRVFDLMAKVQILAVLPAGVGLAVMVPDYLSLLYGQPFLAAVPTARVLIALLFAETALALGLVLLWVDERHRAVLIGYGILLAGAPLFIWTAGVAGLLPAAVVLGGSRLAASAFGHFVAERAYGVRYPWKFAGRVGLVAAVMAVVLTVTRAFWPASPVEALTLTAAGVVVVIVGLRLARALGPDDLDVLDRTGIPGRHLLVRWLGGASSRAPERR